MKEAQLARRDAALARVVSADGRLISRRSLVDEKIEQGYRVSTHKEGRRLSHPDGRYLSESAIGKTAMDYAENALLLTAKG